MSRTNFNELLEAGVHFGHLKRKWNPGMAPYIFMERNGIHIIDLYKTEAKIEDAANALKQIAKSGRKILFVATKKQAKDIVSDKARKINMPYVTERWPGGMLTNFPTIRKAVKKMTAIDKMATEGAFDILSKREKLQIKRKRAKLEKNLGSIVDLTRLPAALFVVDVSKEHIAVREANRLQIQVFGIVDTNSDPSRIDFVIPANDDAFKSISLIIDIIVASILEGLEERKAEREKNAANEKKAVRKTRQEPGEKLEEKKEAKGKTETPEVKKESEIKSESETKTVLEIKTEPEMVKDKKKKDDEVKAETEEKKTQPVKKEPEKEKIKTTAKKSAAKKTAAKKTTAKKPGTVKEKKDEPEKKETIKEKIKNKETIVEKND